MILAACFATDPYQGHGRIWACLGVVALALVALFGVRVEKWIITSSEVRYKSSLWNKELSLDRDSGTPLRIHLELLPRDSEGERPPLPHVVRLFDPAGIEIGEGFRFRERANLDRFLEALRTASPIDVEDLPSGRP